MLRAQAVLTVAQQTVKQRQLVAGGKARLVAGDLAVDRHPHGQSPEQLGQEGGKELAIGHDEVDPLVAALETPAIALDRTGNELPALDLPGGAYLRPEIAEQLDVVAAQAGRPAEAVEALQEHLAVGLALRDERQLLRATDRGIGDPGEQLLELHAAEETRLVDQHQQLAEVRHAIGPEGADAMLERVLAAVERLERRAL